MFRFLNQAAIVQDLGRDLFTGVEVLIERRETDLDPALFEDVCKALPSADGSIIVALV